MTTFAGRVEAKIVIPSGGAAVSVTDSMATTVVTVPAGSYYLTAAGGVSSIITAFATALNAAMADTFTVTISTTTGLVTINDAGNTWSITWTSTVLRDLLGFAGNISAVSTAQTGTKQARGLWFPDCPLNMAGDPKRAPRVSDLRTTISPTGKVLGLVGNVYRRHEAVVWSHVPIARVWEAEAATVNASWEQFFLDTQLGQGLSWFTPSSSIQIYDHSGNMVGSDATLTGWTMLGVNSIRPPKSVDQWSGLWRIEIPSLVAEG